MIFPIPVSGVPPHPERRPASPRAAPPLTPSGASPHPERRPASPRAAPPLTPSGASPHQSLTQGSANTTNYKENQDDRYN
jgi:hypothetical protein